MASVLCSGQMERRWKATGMTIKALALVFSRLLRGRRMKESGKVIKPPEWMYLSQHSRLIYGNNVRVSNLLLANLLLVRVMSLLKYGRMAHSITECSSKV